MKVYFPHAKWYGVVVLPHFFFFDLVMWDTLPLESQVCKCSTLFLPTSYWSECSHTIPNKLRGMLGNVVSLCAQEEGGSSWKSVIVSVTSTTAKSLSGSLVFLHLKVLILLQQGLTLMASFNLNYFPWDPCQV